MENLLHIQKKDCTHCSLRQNNYCNSLFGNHIKDNEITILIKGLSLHSNKLDRNWEIEFFCIVSAISQGIPITMRAKCF